MVPAAITDWSDFHGEDVRIQRIVLVILLALLLFTFPASAWSDHSGTSEAIPTRYGFGALLGSSYDPEHIGLALLQGQVLFDYDEVFWHAAPDSLRFKLEANVGLTLDGRHRGLVAVNMMALNYLDNDRLKDWTPYVEAGVGVIYSDFQVDGQGLRINFNPQAGFGFELPLLGGAALTVSARLHHLSNGNTHEDNRGINSALVMIGYLF